MSDIKVKGYLAEKSGHTRT